MASFLEDYYWVLIIIIMAVLGLSAIAIWAIQHCRKKSRYEYSALEEESLLNDRLELDRKHQKDSVRSLAMINCQYYLRGSTRYILLSQLNELGSRMEKHWFLVRDGTTKTERLMTLTPVVFKSCPFKVTTSTRKILLELFLMLQHPYVYPILDFDFKMLSDQLFAIVVMPFNEKGSLKDLIYHSNCHDDCQEKYQYHGEGLELKQIQRLGRQILEGLLFLQEKGYPPFGHLHSGNVIIQNGVARVSALENPLLGHSPKILTTAQKRLKENRDGLDSISFGHLLFEMSSGYELSRAHPTEKHYADISHLPQITKVLKFIFEQETPRYPSIQEISCLDFFRNIDLRELRSSATMPVFHNKVSPASKALLKDIRKQVKQKRTSKRSQSTSAIETASTSSRDSIDSRSGRSKQRTMSGSQTLNTLSDLHSTLAAEELMGIKSDRATLLEPLPESPPSAQSTFQTPRSSNFKDLAGAAGSSQTMASLSNTSGSTEYYTPPDTPVPTRLTETEDLFAPPLSHRERLLAEIRERWKSKKIGDFDPLDV